MRRWFLAASLLALAGCDRREPLPIYSPIPDFTLTDQAGQEFRSEKLAGKIWIADFVFTNCTGPCPRMTSQMRMIQNKVKDAPDVRLVSFTVDPARDTPEVLAAYAKRFQADPARWFFLTGHRETLHKLSREAFLLGDVDASLTHSTRFVLIDRRGRIRGYYMTDNSANLEKLVEDVRQLLDERSS